jgi:hypothetical protein
MTDMTGNFKFSKLNFPDSSQSCVSARNNPNSKGFDDIGNRRQLHAGHKKPIHADEVADIDSSVLKHCLLTVKGNMKIYTF